MNNNMPVKLQSYEQSTLEAFLKTIAGTGLSQLKDKHLQQWLKVLICSDFVQRQFIHHKDLIAHQWLAGDYFRAFAENEMADKLAEQMQAVQTASRLFQLLRHFRNQQMVRIAWRDINGLADVNEVMNDLSQLADCCIKQSLLWLDNEQQKEFGTPLNSEGNPIELIVIGMGKLGAHELNFSSDIDLIFTFSEHGVTVNGHRSISHNEYFIKLGQGLIRALDQNTADGFVFRVDMRLRPFGQSGPLVSTFDALENYYAAHGREWERYAMIKARAITGSDDVRAYLHSLLTPFVYRRYIDFSVFESLREMKSMIAREVKQKKKEHNIKLGAGGIREIEFLVQGFQLLRGGCDAQFQERKIKKVLSYIHTECLLPEYVVVDLLYSYDFLRRTEHRIQQIDDKQTHTLPDSDYLRARIAYGMNYSCWDSFALELKKIRTKVHDRFEQLLHAPQMDDAENADDDVQGIWQGSLSDERAAAILTEIGYQDGLTIVRLLNGIRDSHRYRKMSREAGKRLDRLMPLVLKLVALAENSEITFKRIMDVIESIFRRSVYMALLAENPLGLSQLVKLCAASSWITRLLSRYPALFDELLDARVLYAPLQRRQLFQELEEKMSLIAMDDLEQRMEALRYFKLSHSLRVAAADLTNIMPIMKVSDYLTWIAEVILHFVLQTAWHDMVSRYGLPQEPSGDDDPSKSTPYISEETAYGFGLVGFGKMGGIELGYSSDLDMVFFFADSFSGGSTTGDKVIGAALLKNRKSVDNLQFYSKLSLRIMHILQTQTHSGVLYEADMRLRPNGHSGLITNTLKAFRKYELEKAWTWEHQALVRARFVCGDEKLIEGFETIRREVLCQHRETESLKKQVREMRAKMCSTLVNKKKGYFDIKYGFGGIADIEFMVQFLVLNYANDYPELLNWTDNIRILDTLAQTHLISTRMETDLNQSYQQYREYLHHLSLQEAAGIVTEDKLLEERIKVQEYWREFME